MKTYAGIGSRETPPEILKLMTEIARVLEQKGWTLRSGGAPGADLAFEHGAINKEIYLPWRGFNGSQSQLYNVSLQAIEMAEPHHPGWKYLKDPVKKLMGRNAYQVLGYNLDKKSKFVICWTQDGCESAKTRTSKTGGTGLAISLADSLGIPIFNLANKESYNRVVSLMAS